MRKQERPDHPDFWLISEAILDQDAQSDSGQDTREITGRMIDPESLEYAAVQRALRITSDPQWVARLAGAWMDAFLAGMCVQRRKG